MLPTQFPNWYAPICLFQKPNNLFVGKSLLHVRSPLEKRTLLDSIWHVLLGAHQKSPMWEIYALFPRSESFQQLEIEGIKAANPGFILIFDFPLDGREELRFRNTHALIHQYISDNVKLLPDSPNPAYQIYTIKRAVQ
jgi:hypothetical protein